MQKQEDNKPHFDYIKLMVYIFIAGGNALYVTFRITMLYGHNLFIGVVAGLITLAALVWVLYLLDKSSRYY